MNSRETFRWSNPVVDGPAWICDAFILRVGDRYYLTGTSKRIDAPDETSAWPGFYLWSSDDLQHWTEEGQLIGLEQIRWSDRHLWAPEIRWHPRKQRFYPCLSQYYAKQLGSVQSG